MKPIIFKIRKVVTEHPTLVTIGLGLAITFAVGGAIGMLDGTFSRSKSGRTAHAPEHTGLLLAIGLLIYLLSFLPSIISMSKGFRLNSFLR